MRHHRPRRRAALAAVAATALLTAGLGTGAPASAAPGAQEASRLPGIGEVAEIYTFLAEDGVRRLLPAGRRVEAPNPTDVDGGGLGCTTDQTVARSAGGRTARYQRGSARFGSESPQVQERRFASPAQARAAYERVLARVERCEGRFPTRAGVLVRRTYETPRFGQARVAYRETDDGFSTYRVRVVVLRGDRLVLTQHLRSDGPPSAARLTRLTRLALRTL